MSETHLIEQAPSVISGMELDEGMYKQQMDMRATESFLQTANHMDMDQDQISERQVTSKKTVKSSSSLPENIVTYVEDNQINKVMKKALNKVIRERPADPFATLAMVLLDSAEKSFPVFDKIKSSQIYLNDSLVQQTLKLEVFMTYHGRSELRHIHYYTFDDV